MPKGWKKGYQKGTNINHNEPRALQTHPPWKNIDGSVANSLLFGRKCLPQESIWEPFWTRKLFKTNTQIDADRIEKLALNSYQNGTNIDTPNRPKIMPKHVATKIMIIMRNPALLICKHMQNHGGNIVLRGFKSCVCGRERYQTNIKNDTQIHPQTDEQLMQHLSMLEKVMPKT